MITVEYHDELNEVQGNAALCALLGQAASAPFDRLAWWQGLVDDCGMAPLLVIARDGADWAMLPLARKDGTLAALANWYSFRVKPIISPQADGLALLTAMARSLATRAPRITLHPLPDEGGEASLVEQAFRAAGWAVTRAASDTNHILPVNGRSFAAYMASRPGQLRSTLKRRGGKVSVTLEQHFDPASWQAYVEIYANSWKPHEGSPAFLRRFAQAEAEAGRMRFGLARTPDGTPVAAQFWTVEGGTAFIHKLAHREDAKPLSPGTTLSAALFEQVIDRDGVTLVDFGTGDDGYKRDWMEDVRPRWRLDMYRRENPRNWPIMARNSLSRLAGRVKLG